VLEDGQIVERGKHEELLAREHLQTTFDLQFRYQEPSVIGNVPKIMAEQSVHISMEKSTAEHCCHRAEVRQ